MKPLVCWVGLFSAQPLAVIAHVIGYINGRNEKEKKEKKKKERKKPAGAGGGGGGGGGGIMLQKNKAQNNKRS